MYCNTRSLSVTFFLKPGAEVVATVRTAGLGYLPTVYKLRAVAKRHRLMTSRFCRAERAAGCKAAKHGKCNMQIVASTHDSGPAAVPS